MPTQQYLDSLEAFVVDHIRNNYSLPESYVPEDEMPLSECGIDDYFSFTFDVAEMLNVDECVNGDEANENVCIDQFVATLAECGAELPVPMS